jgi:hypothetical protein
MIIKERDQTLYSSKYLSLVKRDDWYEFCHSIAGKGLGVMILPYDLTNANDPKILARFEYTPCHQNGFFVEKSGKKLFMTSITGQADKPGKSLIDLAMEELKEEAGIFAEENKLEDLGFIYPSKMSDTEIKIFAYDASNSFLNEPKGDGSLGEQDAFVRWESANFVIENCNCPIVSCAYLRLLNKKLLENYFSKIL